MAELARGTVLDRPWGRTFAALGLRGVTGQLSLYADNKAFHVAFDQGIVVAAASPLALDAAARLALTLGLISTTQVSEVMRRQAAEPGRDEIDVLVETVRISPDHGMRLRRRVTAQRAARTFSFERAEFVVTDEITLPIVPGAELDIRSIVYLGAKQMLSETRLNRELGQLGAWFQIKAEAAVDLPQFGFGQGERSVIGALLEGAGLADLERPDVDQRTARAVVYALVSCNMCDVDAHARPANKRSGAAAAPVAHAPSTGPQAAAPRAATPTQAPAPARAATPTQAPAPARAATPTQAPAPARAATPVPARTAAPAQPASRTPATASSSTRAGRFGAQSREASDAQATDVVELIQSRLAVLDRRGDHFELFGLPRDASPKQVRDGYFGLARQLHPDKLSSVGITDDDRRAQRLMAEVNTAFAVLSDTKRRAEYLAILERGGVAKVQEEEQEVDAMTMRILESEEAFKRGERALKSDQISLALRELGRAVELKSDEPEYAAALVYAKFLDAPDKQAVAASTRAMLGRVIKAMTRPVQPRYYLGRVERVLGRDDEAREQFTEVLAMQPRHAEANGELRAMDIKKQPDKPGGGLFSRFKR